MGASIETLVTVCDQEQCWLARFGPDHHHYGDPYTGTLIIVRRDETALVIGHSGPVITGSERRHLMTLMRARGMVRTRWDRRERGHVAELWI